MIDWHVGQKVVCVDASGDEHPRDILSGSLREGAVYTIREIEPWKGSLGIRVAEIVCRRSAGYGGECGFLIRRFRPVVEPKADISKLQAILDRLPKREVVDA